MPKFLTVLRTYGAIPIASGLSVLSVFPAFASGDSTPAISADMWAPIINAITGQITVTVVVAALAALVTACIGFVFMWWGIRKVANSITSAVFHGQLNI